MRALGITVAVLGVVAISIALLTAQQHLVAEAPPVDPAVPPVEGAADPQPSSSTTERPQERRAVRAVQPSVVAVPPVDPESLERIEPRAPLGAIGLAVPPDVPERFRIFRPIASAAGRVEAAGYTVAIAGTAPVEPGETCVRDDGGTWPCGVVARTAFRNFIRGRALECATPGEPLAGTLVTDCVLGTVDVGSWLVANGWARAAEGGPYKEDAQAARDKRLGIHGPGPTPPNH